MREVDRLRAEAKKLRGNVTAKIGRIRRSYGIDVSNTSNDPRLPNSQIDRMSSRQLTTYLNKTRSFLDRNHGFVQGARQSIIPLSEWQAYRRVERKFNSLADRHKERFADMVIPGSTMTVAERDEEIRSRRPGRKMISDASNRPLERIERSPEHIASVKALRKMRRDLERRLKPGAYEKAMKAAKSQANTMLKGIGSPSLTKFVKGLSDEEFDFLWFYGKLAHDLSQQFDSDAEGQAMVLDPGFETVRERAEDDILSDGGWREMFDRHKNGA